MSPKWHGIRASIFCNRFCLVALTKASLTRCNTKLMFVRHSLIFIFFSKHIFNFTWMYNSFILFNYTFLKNKITKSIVKNLHQTTLMHLRGQNRYKNIPIHETSYIRYRIRNVPHIQESKELLQEIQKNECMFLFLEIQKSLDQYSTL